MIEAAMKRLLVLAPALLAACKDNPLYCDSTTRCADPTQVCITRTNECVPVASAGDLGIDLAPAVDLRPMACATAADCTAGAPSCAGGRCGACATGSTDCQRFAGTPVCGLKGACVQCLNGSDCAAQHQACDTTNAVCVPCVQNADCFTGVCKSGGACADALEVAYVDNHADTVVDCKLHHMNADGKSPGTAFCDVQDALTPVTRPFVVVAGSSQPYGAISLVTGATDVTVTIVGPGRDAMPPATLQDPTGNSPAATLGASGGKTGTMSLEGLVLQGAPKAGVDGVQCNNAGGTAGLTVQGCRILGAGGAGLSAKACDLVLDEDLVTGNQGGGLNIDAGSSYQVSNCFVVDNGDIGVLINRLATGQFQFNTVARNHPAAGNYGGIDCSAGGVAKPIVASIVWGNTATMGTQIVNNCSLDGVVTGADSFSGAVMLDPQFVSGASMPYDFHLAAMSAMNKACCVDKRPTGPDHDFDGSHRPKGAAWDVGAHEVE
jgi:hypothetical protein